MLKDEFVAVSSSDMAFRFRHRNVTSMLFFVSGSVPQEVRVSSEAPL